MLVNIWKIRLKGIILHYFHVILLEVCELEEIKIKNIHFYKFRTQMFCKKTVQLESVFYE